jgi:tetratricopeptide (TPR) repeat protein
MVGKMLSISKISLYIAIIAIFSILSANCEETPSIKDTARVTLDNEPLVNVYSLYYCDSSTPYYDYYNYIEYVIGHSTFKVPFANIHKLDIYKERDKYYINITDLDMNTIEKRALKTYSNLRGTADDNGIKGEFNANIKDYSKITIIGINEKDNTQGINGSAEIIHIIPSSSSKKAEAQECDENGICKKHQALTPTNLLLLVTVDNPLALNEGVSSDNADSAKQWLYQGNDYYNNTSFEEALNCYEKAIVLVNNSPTLWYYKGDALYQLRKYADAVQAYKKATDLAPNFVEAWNNLALSYKKLGLTEEANNAFAEKKKLESNS